MDESNLINLTLLVFFEHHNFDFDYLHYRKAKATYSGYFVQLTTTESKLRSRLQIYSKLVLISQNLFWFTCGIMRINIYN